MRVCRFVVLVAGLGACAWQLASAFAGASLKPTIGVCYEPLPSDFTSWQQGGAYPPTGGDFTNDDFSQLWDAGGRNDLQTMNNWGANAVRLYNMKTYLKHASFFNRAADLNMKVLASVSNEMLLGSNIDSAIPQLVNEVKGAASVAAWAVSNELSADNRCKPISNCLDTLTKAVNMVANLDPGRPVMVVTVFDGGFQSAKVVRNALAKAYPNLANNRFILGINMYFEEDPSNHRGILTNVLRQYFNDPDLKNTPLMVTEYGRSSVAPYSPESQAAAISAQASTLAQFARSQDFPLFLGSFLFIFSDTNLQNSHKTFGVMAYSGKKSTVNGGRGPYYVDELTCKPGCRAFQNAIGGGSDCPQVAGYTLTNGADHNGDDINCQPFDSATAAAGRCNGDASCKSFNTYQANGALWTCTKRASGPVTPTAGICFYAKGGSKSCPQVTGYTLTMGVDHSGDDIGCQATDTANTAASLCSTDPACKAFNTFDVNGKPWACTKRTASPVNASAGTCFYSKQATINCPQVTGYTLTTDVDHYGDDISCQTTDSSNAAADRCSVNSACKAFNIYTANGASWSCAKRVSGPTSPGVGICFYTKTTSNCPQVSGYTLNTDMDHDGDDINCQPTTTVNAAAGRCNADGNCKAFNSYVVSGGTAWACTKRTASPLSVKPGICFYTKTSTLSPNPYNCASSNSNGGRTLYVQNKCSQTVWLTVLANAGKSPYNSETLFAMPPGSFKNVALPANWAGRFYGKIGCNNGGGGCLPGPFTLAEITFLPGADDFYDVSLVDGYNLAMTFTPVDSQCKFIGGANNRRCTTAGCISDLLRTCSQDLQVRGGSSNSVVACKSACSKFGTPQYCCTGSFSCGPQCCPPTNFSRIFSAACPYAYSYAYDDKAGTFTCPNASANGGYQLNFCI